MLYAIENPKAFAVKFGYSKSREGVKGRLDSLQTASACKLTLLAVCGGELADERAIHARFKKYRKSGEWFEANGTTITFARLLERHGLVGAIAEWDRITSPEFLAELPENGWGQYFTRILNLLALHRSGRGKRPDYAKISAELRNEMNDAEARDYVAGRTTSPAAAGAVA